MLKYRINISIPILIPFLTETYLMHGRQIVEYALQFILLNAIADHDQLLEEKQNIGAYG